MDRRPGVLNPLVQESGTAGLEQTEAGMVRDLVVSHSMSVRSRVWQSLKESGLTCRAGAAGPEPQGEDTFRPCRRVLVTNTALCLPWADSRAEAEDDGAT